MRAYDKQLYVRNAANYAAQGGSNIRQNVLYETLRMSLLMSQVT